MGQKVDRLKWGMHASEVNAYYSPNMNEMAFPAGILQPPFFSKDAPMVLNFASIGAVMGEQAVSYSEQVVLDIEQAVLYSNDCVPPVESWSEYSNSHCRESAYRNSNISPCLPPVITSASPSSSYRYSVTSMLTSRINFITNC